MDLITSRVKGTQDVLPDESYRRQFVEKLMLETSQLYGFGQIRTPVFEHTELFNRSVGDTTDVVQKEMYTFDDKGGRSITLRPEGTSPTVRAMLENGLHNNGFPLRLSYLMSCYRYEKPQAGRFREFTQFGAEIFGSDDPAADAELIMLANGIFRKLGISGLELQINSIGCPECRKNYHEALKKYFEVHKDKLCHTCLERLDRNPMRILDCKSSICSEVSKDAPVILDFICDDCKNHFETLKIYLQEMNVKYSVNSRIVRGLDYYTRTVFEFISRDIGAQGAIGGGGRYDGLVNQIGGISVPAVGFGLGFDRIMLLLENQNVPLPELEKCVVYIAGLGEDARRIALRLAHEARKYSIPAQCDIIGRGLKAQLKFADKIGAKFSLVIGDEEIQKNSAILKNMSTGETKVVSLDPSKFGEVLMNADIEARFSLK